MKGLEISRLYYEHYVRPMLREQFPEWIDCIAVGLAGEGSECLGFDDGLSRDHDFGPGVCLWFPRRMAPQLEQPLRAAYAALPKSIPECAASPLNPERAARVGPQSIEDFYERRIGRSTIPTSNWDWLRLPEKYLSQATSGIVFTDPLGEFSSIREQLLRFYPEDVKKKKLAANCAIMAQAGQYNYPRCIQRQDFGAAYLACGEFIRAALAALYLLNERYMPFYKWAFRGAEAFPILPSFAEQLRVLASLPDLTAWRAKQERIEALCQAAAKELLSRGWCAATDSFLQVHAVELTRSLRDPQLQALPLMMGGV